MTVTIGNATQVATPSFDQFAPRIAALVGGGWVITWETTYDSLDYIMAQIFDENGVAEGNPIAVDNRDSNDTVAGLTDGGFVVAANGAGAQLFRLYDDDGTPRSLIVSAGDSLDGEPYPEIALNDDGIWAYVTGYRMVANDNQAGESFVATWTPESYATAVQTQPVGDGSWLISYSLQRAFGTSIYYQPHYFIRDENGDIEVADTRLGYLGRVVDSVSLSDGSVVLLQSHLDPTTATKTGFLYANIIGPSGAESIPTIEIAAVPNGTHRATVAATEHGGFVVAYSTTVGHNASLTVVGYNADGTAAFDPIEVAQDRAAISTAYIVADEDGDFAVFWQDYSESTNSTALMVQVFSFDGQVLTPAQMIHTQPDDGGVDYRAVSVANNQFVVTYDQKQTAGIDAIFQHVISYSTDPTASGETLVVLEDTPLALSLSNIGYADGDRGALSSVNVTFLPSNGTLTLNGNAVSVGQTISPTDFDDLIYTPPADKSGDALAEIGLRVLDEDGNTSSPFSITINVTPVVDVFRGTNRADTLRGTGEGDKFIGLRGDDILITRAGDDIAKGGRGEDVLRGQAGHDTLRGNGQDDKLFGHGGRDKLVGGNHDDILRGGKGRDELVGGKGDDLMNGGKAIDTFVFRGTFGNDTITDFDAVGRDHDVIDLSDIAMVRGWADLRDNHLTQNADGVLIQIGVRSVELLGVEIADLNKVDFLL